MPFYIFAWVASFSSAFTILITKFTTKHSIRNPWFFNFLWSVVIVLFTIPPAMYYHAGMPKDWTSLIIAAFFATLWYVFYIISMYKLDVTTLSPLFNFRTVFAVLMGVGFLGEHLSLQQYFLCGVIVIAGIFATIDEKFSLRSFFRSSILFGLLAMLFLALNNGFIKLALIHNDLWTANFWMAIISLLMLFPTIPLFFKDIKKINGIQILPVAGMGILQTITNFAANIAYSANVSVTSLIMAAPLSMVMVWMLSIYAPKLLEKHTHKVYAIRLSAAIVMIVCALQVSR
jgi:drug/metabolite transporter (DMT)-like permease